jgi:hypothetical protein
MSDRIKTHIKSPYIGLFQYKTSGPASIHSNPNNTLLPTNIPYIGTFKHNFPCFMHVPNRDDNWNAKRGVLKRQNYLTQDASTQTETTTTETTTTETTTETTITTESSVQTDIDLDAYVIVKYIN